MGDDDPIDELPDGAAGGTNRAGSSGSSGSSGVSGSGGTSGSAGSMSIGNAGSGGSDSIPTPVCTDESGDDACLTCIKQQCCTDWQACNTTTCQDQRETLIECVAGSGDPDMYNDVCIPLAADPDTLLAEETQALMLCVNEIITEGDAGIMATRCGLPCFGDDLFMAD